MSIDRAGSTMLRDERGSVFLLSLVLVGVITLLGMALFSLATIEGDLAHWDAVSTQAFFCAEGGAARALRELGGQAVPAPAPLSFSGVTQAVGSPFGDCSYVVVYAAGPTTLTATGTIRGESRTVRYTGQAFGLDQAILVNGDLSVSGNPPVNGACGNVHANGNLNVSGDPDIAGDMTSSGTTTVSGNPTVDGVSGGGMPSQPIPPFTAADFLATAQALIAAGSLTADQVFQLKVPVFGGSAFVTDGNNNPITGAQPNTTCVAGVCTSGQMFRGWKYNTSGPEWDYDTTVANDGTYYIEGHVKMSKDVGTAVTPWNVTVLAAPVAGGDPNKVGNIEISGNPKTRAHLSQTLLVADRDIMLNGSPDQLFQNGVTAAREQIQISGNPPLAGPILALNAGTVSSLVTSSALNGNPSITYGCGATLNIACWPRAGCRRFEEVPL